MWDRLGKLPWPGRSALKIALFLLVLGGVLYPNPVYLVRQISHLRDTEALIQPDLPFIAEINREITATLPAKPTREQELKAVERYVYQAIPYTYDWHQWANVDYWPSAAEVWERRTEDCDGRAILSASILRARGYPDARIVGNLNHVWVVAGNNSLMGAEKDQNFRRVNGKVVITPPKAETVFRGLAQIKHFPFWRLALLVIVGVGLSLHPYRSLRGYGLATAIGLAGLWVLYAWAESTKKGETGRHWVAASVGLMIVSLIMAWALPRLAARFKFLVGKTAVLAPVEA